jgi:hypothetical protein
MKLPKQTCYIAVAIIVIAAAAVLPGLCVDRKSKSVQGAADQANRPPVAVSFIPSPVSDDPESDSPSSAGSVGVSGDSTGAADTPLKATDSATTAGSAARKTPGDPAS